MVCLGVLLPQAFLWVCCTPPRAVAQDPRDMFATSDCVALRLLMPVMLWLIFHLRPQWGGLGVSLQNYKNIYIYLQVHKYINMAIIEK